MLDLLSSDQRDTMKVGILIMAEEADHNWIPELKENDFREIDAKCKSVFRTSFFRNVREG